MKFNLDLARKILKKDIINTYNNFILNQNLIEATKNRFHESQQNYKTVKNGFILGVNTDIQVTEADYDLHISKNEYIKSVMDYMVSELEIKKYSEDLTIRDIESINQLLVW